MNCAYTKIEALPKFVCLRDNCLPGTRSITNDADNVVREILDQYGNVRIIYRDTEKAWSELGHDGFRFTAFKPIKLPNISFSLTTPQFRDRTKTVTRRLGWVRVKPNDVLMAVVKAQGLKKGQHPEKLGPIRVRDARVERLDRMTDDIEYGAFEVVREGFHNMTPEQFVQMFCAHNICSRNRPVTRIQFDYLDD